MDDLTHLRHGSYFNVVLGQLTPFNYVFEGCQTRAEAEEVAATIRPKRDVQVKLLDTIDYDLPFGYDCPGEDPEFDESKFFRSQKWCVVLSNRR